MGSCRVQGTTHIGLLIHTTMPGPADGLGSGGHLRQQMHEQGRQLSEEQPQRKHAKRMGKQRAALPAEVPIPLRTMQPPTSALLVMLVTRPS